MDDYTRFIENLFYNQISDLTAKTVRSMSLKTMSLKRLKAFKST